ncbi:MAG: DPP IV N-terminal domain-containing protein [Bacteroidales bacterium]|nr:DPP IV N-terminal domain-containing protein [Bacteroidales bacterium]
MKLLCLMLALLAPVAVSGADDVNVTTSPDGTMEAFTRGGDLWVRDIAEAKEWPLTTDGSDVILNGYASWVYYEEILGRASFYKAFWWSPDSKKIGYYRFDNSKVPVFPIYSPFGQYGSLNLTRYPKAGDTNPEVTVRIADITDIRESGKPTSVDAAFDPGVDQYFGIPFWSSDSRSFYVAREPRRQSDLDLFAVDASDGSLKNVYHEHYDTWLDWIEEIYFTDSGLYMARSFETGWQQIYFLSYDGSKFKRLTDGRNWDISILKVDEKKGDVWFTARRDSRLHPALYRLDRKGRITSLTDPELYSYLVRISEDGKHFTCRQSTARIPWREIEGSLYAKNFSDGLRIISPSAEPAPGPEPEIVCIENDGFELYGLMAMPRDFDPNKKYPVIMTLYGGPGTPYVRDRWNDRDASDRWAWENGIITIVVDPRSSGENGRRGMDQAFGQMTVIERQDYIAWAQWLSNLPFVDGSRIGVQGFSFGGTTTAMLVLCHPEHFCCGIAGGGVYDWTLYDSHYTERFMDTPQANPEGYAKAGVIANLDKVKPRLGGPEGKDPVLKLTHGTGDDNVHFQSTLQLCDALQRIGFQFDLMIYPDGMHGYRGYQGAHSRESDRLFWSRHLISRD